jgi:hypothetical protein
MTEQDAVREQPEVPGGGQLHSTVIKLLYLLIVAATALSVLLFVIAAFRSGIAFSVFTLFVLAPLLSIIVLATCQLFLELGKVTVRIAEDIRRFAIQRVKSHDSSRASVSDRPPLQLEIHH